MTDEVEYREQTINFRFGPENWRLDVNVHTERYGEENYLSGKLYLKGKETVKLSSNEDVLAARGLFQIG